ncbi:hypothetical protein M1145_01660 [Patescibacteria group bacterium]|nr:hypothetical protein [Patescibacteria group bacterium]
MNETIETKENLNLKKDLLIYKLISLILFILLAVSLIYLVNVLNTETANSTTASTMSSAPTVKSSVPEITNQSQLSGMLNYIDSLSISSAIQNGVIQNNTDSASL